MELCWQSNVSALAQGNLLCNGIHERELKESEYMYMYNWLTLLCTGNKHNIINQLYSQKKAIPLFYQANWCEDDKDKVRSVSSIKICPVHFLWSKFLGLKGKKNCKKIKWLSEEALQITEERRKSKCKGERKIYTQLNAGFQRRARKDKKPFVKEQCKKWRKQ